MHTPTVLSTLVAATALVNNVDAHGYISNPKPEFTPGQVYTNFNAEFTAAQAGTGFSGKVFNRSPEQNTATFTDAFKASGLASLKALMDKFVPGCGNTNPNTTPRDVSGLKTMSFQNNEYKEGFLGSHHGPCEVWIDNTRVFQNNDCAGNYKSYPAQLPVDYSKCAGTCRLTFYWLALHSQKWQAYKQCVPIKNGGGGGGGGAAAGAATGGNGGGAAGAAAGGNAGAKAASGNGGNQGGNRNAGNNGGNNGVKNGGARSIDDEDEESVYSPARLGVAGNWTDY